MATETLEEIPRKTDMEIDTELMRVIKLANTEPKNDYLRGYRDALDWATRPSRFKKFVGKVV